jgi:uncharacterized protein YegP (UPF0339 family)
MDKIIAYCVDLYEKFINLSLVQQIIAYCKEHLVHTAVIGGLLLALIIVLCIMGGKRRKAKKLAKKAAKLAASAPAEETAAPVEEPAVAETVETPATVEEVAVETPVEEKASEPVVEETPAVVAEEAIAVAEEPKQEEVVVEEIVATPVEKTEEKAVDTAQSPSQAEDVNETIAMVEELEEDEEDILRDHYDEDEVDRIARYKGKWVVCRVISNDEDCEEMYFFELHASNGEKLLESEEYTTYQGALRGIQTHKTNILNGNFKIAVTKKGDYIFKLLSGKNMLLCTGENYPTRARCQSAIDSTIRFAATAVLDENVQDIYLKVPQEDNTPIEPLPENCNGKWIISTGLGAEGQKIYYFELFANNGERLLESEEYTTYTGAVNGIRTHKKNIENNNFRISLTKRGDYIYKLLNGNGQLLCLGEHYKTKRACQNAVESVKRFAQNSLLLTNAEHLQ